MNNGYKDRFDLWVIPKMILFTLLAAAVESPLRIFVEAVIEGKEGAPDFVTPAFLVYGFCSKMMFAAGYMLLGHMLPIKNTVLRGFGYVMLIFASSYLPNILALAGGDGEIIEESLSFWIVIVDTLSYVIMGVVLGLLMKKYDPPKTKKPHLADKRVFILMCVLNASVFAALNYLTDVAAGAFSSSWRLCSILGVSKARETSFYIVFTAFMFVAGLLIPLWYRYCMPGDISLRGALLFSLKLSAAAWLPNVLIMAFFGTPVLLTAAYGAAYVLMIAVCVMIYRKINRQIIPKQTV